MDTYNSKMSDVLGTNNISPPSTGSSHINVGDTERIVSLVGGALLAYYGLSKPNAGGIAMAAVGGALLFRGATGYCPMNEALGRDSSSGRDITIEITRSLTINKPRSEVFQFWRQLENLPKFMEHLQDVRQLGPKRSHWVARIPKGVGTVEWNADIVQEEPGSLIAWRSMPGSDIDNAGEVRFTDAPADRGTVVQASISYRAPVGAVGGNIAKLLNPTFRQMVENDLRRFKQLLETGEVVTTEGQPAGKR
ncbi:SRPBCC family protein [Pontibacter saemangeumensis]|uniref:SRPBCC family protein n=1 Tax=Pontibacter saemangeumensis TaxID=1084525 RepID=A0ABP8LXY1_9BACT